MEATLYNGKAKYCGIDVPQGQRLKQLEDENAKLKRASGQKMVRAHRHEDLAHLQAALGLSERGPAPSSTRIAR